MKSNRDNSSNVLVLVCLVAMAAEGFFLTRLYQENTELRGKGIGEKHQVDQKVAGELKKHGTELRVLRQQNQDLLRLRTEVRRLRPLTNEVITLRAQVQSLSAGATPAAIAAAAALAKAQVADTAPDVFIGREDWAFAGFSNAEAALQTVLWAGSQGDVEAFLASLTPDGRAKLEEQAQKLNKSPEEMVNEAKQGFANVTGFRLLEQNLLPDDSVMMRVTLEGQNLTERFFFKKIGDEWHLSDTKSDK